MRTILLKFSGPLQSWGTDSHFEVRHTDRHPSKSAVIGLIAACFGYRRKDDTNISKLNDLEFAVRVDQSGKILRDYHIATKYKAKGDFDRTYVTNRYYIEDATFVVGIGSSDETFLREVLYAIQNPYFQPFMGRRSLPVPSDFILGTSEENVIEALTTLPWQASQWYQKDESGSRPIYADSTLLDGQVNSFRRDKVISFSQKNRTFGYRGEGCIWVDLNDELSKSEHDAFGALGGD